MKITTKIFLTAGLSICILIGCNNSDNNKTSEKELELQKWELDLKQKELELKEKELAQQSNNSQTKTDKSISSTTSTAKTNQTIVKTFSGGYNFDKHNDIKIFIDDLAKAVSTGDKNNIAQMINFPLIDTWGDNPGNQSPSLGCKNINQFFEKYDKIFTNDIIKAITNKKYREGIGGQDAFNKGEYGIDCFKNYYDNRPCIMFGIKKVNGKFKIYAIKFSS